MLLSPCEHFLTDFQIDPKKRPSFSDMVTRLEEIKSRSQMANVLADISNLNRDPDTVMDKTILEKILGESHSLLSGTARHLLSCHYSSFVVVSLLIICCVTACHLLLWHYSSFVVVSLTHHLLLCHILIISCCVSTYHLLCHCSSFGVVSLLIICYCVTAHHLLSCHCVMQSITSMTRLSHRCFGSQL